MTISNTTRRAGPFAGNGVSTTFPFGFKVFSKSDIALTLQTANGSATLLTVDSDYSVALSADQNASPGGTITYPIAGAPLGIGAKLIAIGALPNTQPTDLTNQGGFYPEVLEDALDRAEIQIQQLSEIASRSLHFDVTEDNISGEFPAPGQRANTVFGFDQVGNQTYLPLPSSLGAGDLRFDVFNANTDFTPNVTTQLQLSRAPISNGNCWAYWDGVPQLDCTVTGTTITFPTAIPAGISQVRVRIGTTLSVNAPAQGSVTDESVATGSKLHNRIYDTVSVKDYQAVGDFVSDDTIALQNAINATAATGALLWIPPGTYMISAPLVLPSNTLIDGVGTIKLKNSCTPKPGDILRCNTATNVHVRGITIDANRQNNIDHGTPDANGNQAGNWQGTLLAVVDYAYVTQFSIRNIKVLNSWGSGMWITDCDTGLVEGNYVKDYRITGIALRNDTTSVLPIQNVRVIGNHCEGGVVGIHTIFGVKDSTISGNVCINNKDPNKMPAFAYSGIYPNQWPSTGGFTPYGQPGYVSPAFQGDGAGIEATGVFTDPNGTANLNVSIAGNTCNLNAVGVRLEETTNSFSVTGNTCRGNTFYGVLMLSAYFNTVTGNNCLGNALDGIRMEKITGKPQAGNNQIVGNICTQNGRFGCIVVSSQGNNIVGNNLSGNGADATQPQNGCLGLFSGIDGVFASNNNVESNVLNNFFGTDKYGIYSDSSSNVANVLTGNQFSGAYVTAKTTLAVANNTFARNVGFKTESNGAATIGVGNTFVDVAHGLDIVPSATSVRVSPIGDYGSARWWFASADATNVRIATNTAAAGALPFSWSIAQ